MASLDWLSASLPGLPPALWMSLGLGLPWALALLPRGQWRSRTLVGALALALGPACMTAWLLLLGVAGAALEVKLLTRETILVGSAAIAAAGAWIAWRKRQPKSAHNEREALTFDEKIIIALIAAAVALRWLHTAYFPFTAYDALWVYGYQGRLYFLEGIIPPDIGYYPQFLPLQFAYVQILLGEINDHAARMVLPLLHIGSLLASYQLGARLAGRRVGLYCAALWSLHPHVGQWATVGDLEIPLAFSFTMAAAFFISAWMDPRDASSRRDALLGGLMLGIALYTKPTAGAFIWGVGLCLLAALLQARLDISRWLPRLRVALWTGVACLPLGGVWYARNWLLGHDVVTFPKSLWLSRALRSGDYLMPLIVAVVLAFAAIAWRSQLARRQWALGGAGIALLLAGALASNAALFPQRADPPASYIQLAEALAMAAGLALMGVSLRKPLLRAARLSPPPGARAAWWGLLLAAPYFATFFFSYSYHYRLGFAALPLLILPSALALAALVQPQRMSRAWQRAYCAALLLLCLPGIAAVGFDARWSSIWLLRGDLDSDWKKQQVFNPSLMEVEAGLNDFQREHEIAPIVVAPGEERLPFFFPQMTILDQTVTRLDELEALAATHFVYGAKARAAYSDAGIDPLSTQLIAALGRQDLVQLRRSHYDGYFSYELYETRNLARRHARPVALDSASGTVEFGGVLQLDLPGAHPERIRKETPITIEPAWRATQPLERDYLFVVRLYNRERKLVARTWTFEAAPHRHGAYATSHWEVGELVQDRQVLRLGAQGDSNGGYDFLFQLGVWDAQAGAYLPLTIDGAPAGSFYQAPRRHRVRLSEGYDYAAYE